MAEQSLPALPARVNAMALALSFVEDGTLRVNWRSGRVWRFMDSGRACEPRLAERPDSKGYLRITLGVPGRKKTCHVQAHCLIWTVANGPIPEGLQVNHKDTDKQNNVLDNLELVTGAGNIQHSYANGRNRPYFKTVTKASTLAPQAKALRAAGLMLKEIAERLGVSVSHAQRMVNRKEVGRGSANA